MANPITNRKPTERRGQDDDFGVSRDRREADRRVAERRKENTATAEERRSGEDRRQKDEQREQHRRSGADRRAVSERLNRVSAILLPRLLGPREDEDAVFEKKAEEDDL